MSFNISKVNIEIMNITLELLGKQLTEEQIAVLYTKLMKIDKNDIAYANTYPDMIEKMKENYHIKSSKQLEYFVRNQLKSKHKQTGVIKDYTFHNGIFKYYNDFKYRVNTNNIKDIDLIFKEHNKGGFLNNKDRLYSIKKISKVMYLDYMNKDKEKVFITFTLPNMNFHKYNKNQELTRTYTSNDKFEKNLIKGLKLLNEMHRYFYHTLKYQVKRYSKKIGLKNKNTMNIDFIKMLEPQKSLDGHLHSLFYIDNQFLDLIEKVYNMTVNKFKLLQTKFEILENIKGSSYLTKYLLKTTRDENIFYNHYKRFFNKIRFFSSSGFRHTNQEKIELVYKYLNQNKPKLLQRYKKSNKPLYYWLEKLIKNNTFTFEEKEEIKTSVNYLKINKEYKKIMKFYKKISNTKYKNKQHLLDKLKVKRINQFKENIIKNLQDYIDKIKYKKIEKVYYKKELIINKNDWLPIKNFGYEFEFLKLNPFESKEVENNLFCYN